MQHVLIGVALLSFLVLDLVFVSYSDTSSAALAFGLLSYTTLLLLSAWAGTLTNPAADYENPLESLGVPGILRPVLAAVIPVALLLILAFLREMDSLIDPREAVRLGSTFTVFWLLAALALVGAVLGFIRPRTGAAEAVVAGGLVVLAQSLLSQITQAADRESLQLALYTWMIWISVCLIGAWLGMVLRQTIDYQTDQADGDQLCRNEPEEFTSAQQDAMAGGGVEGLTECAGSNVSTPAPTQASQLGDSPGEAQSDGPE